MPYFILPAVVDNRKAVLLDLFPKDSPQSSGIINNDIYISALQTGSQEILVIERKDRFLQSLVSDQDDIALTEMGVSFSKEDGQIMILLTKNVNPDNSTVETKITNGLTIRASFSEDKIVVSLRKTAQFTYTENLSSKLVIVFEKEEEQYQADLTFYFADPRYILQAGLDFGSEASQMVTCRADEFTTQHVNIIENLKKTYYPVEHKENQLEQNTLFQSEENNPYFYKSTFFIRSKIQDGIKKYDSRYSVVDTEKTLKILTIKGAVGDAKFHAESKLVPNLKLLNNMSGLDIRVQITEQKTTTEKDLIEISDEVYFGMLESFIRSFFESQQQKTEYLRLTFLVPNIYTIEKINRLKAITRLITDQYNAGKSVFKAVEISTISESDASFMGCLAQIANLNPNQFYLIIDCGKGTTDFSIIRTVGVSTCRSEYRNGFAGAGNLISFAFLQSLIHYITNHPSLTEPEQQAIKRFFTSINNDPNYKRLLFILYENVERWKKNYKPQLTKQTVESEWEGVLEENNTSFANIFLQSDNLLKVENELSNFLKQVNNFHDWGDYILDATSFISFKIQENLGPVINQIRKEARCGSIIFTGRGFYFEPLRISVQTALEQIKGIEQEHFLPVNSVPDLKKVCMQGIFNHSLITNSDIVSTPVEIRSGEKKDSYLKSHSQVGFLNTVLDKINDLINKTDSEFYSMNQNILEVKNTGSLSTIRFWTGGGKYMFPVAAGTNMKSAHLIQSRSGIYIVVKSLNDTSDAYKLILDGSNVNRSRDEKAMLKSLFFGYFYADLLFEKC